MAISVFEIFKIGIGPSSSHTVGPRRAAIEFATKLENAGLFSKIDRLTIELFSSLGATGKGHGIDKAVMLGLQGEEPDLIDPSIIPSRLLTIRQTAQISLLKQCPIRFDDKTDLLFHRKVLPFHSNGMRFFHFRYFRT